MDLLSLFLTGLLILFYIFIIGVAICLVFVIWAFIRIARGLTNPFTPTKKQ